jgi:hypothetical protein
MTGGVSVSSNRVDERPEHLVRRHGAICRTSLVRGRPVLSEPRKRIFPERQIDRLVERPKPQSFQHRLLLGPTWTDVPTGERVDFRERHGLARSRHAILERLKNGVLKRAKSWRYERNERLPRHVDEAAGAGEAGFGQRLNVPSRGSARDVSAQA